MVACFGVETWGSEAEDLSPKVCHSLAGKYRPEHLTSLSFIILSSTKWFFFLKFIRDFTYYKCMCLNTSSQKHLLYSLMSIKVLATLNLHFTISYFYSNWISEKNCSHHYSIFIIMHFIFFFFSPPFLLSLSLFHYSDINVCEIWEFSGRNFKNDPLWNISGSLVFTYSVTENIIPKGKHVQWYLNSCCCCFRLNVS